jgi:hypothetical protein
LEGSNANHYERPIFEIANICIFQMTGIIAIENPDKGFHENWSDQQIEGVDMRRHPMNVPHPFRCVLMGPPGVGKTTIILNLIMRQQPPFRKVYVIHVDGEYSKEYDALGKYVKLSSVPDPSWWPGQDKSLVVLDDLEYKTMNKTQKRTVDRLFGYVSTHKNISVALTSQDPFNIFPIVRRCADLWVLWKTKDIDSVANIARKAGLFPEQLRSIFKDFKLRDSLWIDTTPNTLYPLRINGDQIIDESSLATHKRRKVAPDPDPAQAPAPAEEVPVS